ncbi:oligosaccharide biosynthesis protein Alg14 like-domain-containing protein [Apiosordaria backusii]|uniref:UDP-N-acetylglucosamine transferase subunit ALG14 n=1 Tax=Apiosordaria backusii TaxID=314023 RepID=A0AA40BEB9_9PEZI|nr:oligosaccharide biosynthesis protein Alg14 like-domain-containing protein [Apiosordaria backusii]
MDPHIPNHGESQPATHKPLGNLTHQAQLPKNNQKQEERAPAEKNSKPPTSSFSPPSRLPSPPTATSSSPTTPTPQEKPSLPPPPKSSPPAEEEDQPKMLESIDEMGGEGGWLGVLAALLFAFVAAAAAVVKLSWPALATVGVVVCSGAVCRHLTLSSSRGRARNQLFPAPATRSTSPAAPSRDNILGRVPAAYYLYVLGSGGHTTEMFETIKNSFSPSPHQHRRYVLTTGDTDSLRRLLSLESFVDWAYPSSVPSSHGTRDTFTIPRARKVHQPLWTAPFTCLVTAVMAVKALSTVPGQRAGSREERERYRWPSVVVTNGPGTGFIVAAVAYGMKLLGIVPRDRCKVVYIESWARISSLSLTGRMFYWTGIAEVFGVQHRGLVGRYKGVVYVGEVFPPEPELVRLPFSESVVRRDFGREEEEDDGFYEREGVGGELVMRVDDVGGEVSTF